MLQMDFFADNSRLSMHFLIVVLLMFLPSGHLLLLRKATQPALTNIAKFASNPQLKGIARKLQRVERIISNRGAGTRREAESLIWRGLVVVNGNVVKSPNEKCLTSEDIYVDGVCYPAAHMAVYHKPLGVLSSIGDTKGRPNLKEVISSNSILQGMHPVGRLDADSTGLLLFSKDGKLTNFLLSPTNRIEREYRAVVVGNVDYEKLKLQLKDGVQTTDGKIKAKLLDSSVVSEEQKVRNCMYFMGGDYHNAQKSWFPTGIKVYHTEVKPLTDEEQSVEDIAQKGELELTLSGDMLVRQPLSVVNLTVVEGKYRMVRRILHNSGHSVVSLHRTRYGGIQLRSKASQPEDVDEGQDDEAKEAKEAKEVELPESAVRYLTPEENEWIQRLIKGRLKL